MKALKLLKKYREIFLDVTAEEPEDFDEIGINLVNQIDEAIAELEALQSRSCEGCKHLLASPRICLKRIQNCDGILPKDFCCNRHEPKENL